MSKQFSKIRDNQHKVYKILEQNRVLTKIKQANQN